jgi:hypothetical protein
MQMISDNVMTGSIAVSARNARSVPLILIDHGQMRSTHPMVAQLNSLLAVLRAQHQPIDNVDKRHIV